MSLKIQKECEHVQVLKVGNENEFIKLKRKLLNIIFRAKNYKIVEELQLIHKQNCEENGPKICIDIDPPLM